MQKAVLLFCAATVALPAQTFSTLASFGGSNGVNPQMGALVQGSDGNLYGTTLEGGANIKGAIFKVTPAGVLTALYSFAGTDGQSPMAGLVQASDGNFYGTTNAGGANSSGTIFKVTPSGTLTTLYSFCALSNCTDGKNSMAGLVQASDGNLYGTTTAGGANGDGAIFKITLAGAYSTLYSFSGPDGSAPYAPLMQAADGNLYGVTGGGGSTGAGTIFKITLAGALTTLHSFNTTDGGEPYGALIQATDGNFYGTTERGGTNNFGTVFKITPAGAFASLYSFAETDGEQVYAGLVQASDGNLYGTTYGGGVNGFGTIFKITLAGALTVVHSLATADGTQPLGTLMEAADGNLYGTAEMGGANGYGTVFKLSVGSSAAQGPAVSTGSASAVTSSSATLLASINAYGIDTNVWFEYGTNSSLSGSTSTPLHDIGPSTGTITCSATITGLSAGTTYYFRAWASNADGTNEGSISSFTTSGSGTNYTITGTVLLSGSGLNGVTITLSGTQSSSTTTNSTGNYIISAGAGGTYTVTPSLSGYTFSPASATFNNLSADQTGNFTASLVPSGAAFTTLASLLTASNGDDSVSGVIQASNGNFYGPAAFGGSYYGDGVTNGAGTIFQVTPAGVITTLHNFVGTDGQWPEGQLIQASDGNLYGTTGEGGANGGGTIFKISLAGTLTTLYSFCAQTNCSDGKQPFGQLLQASDGYLYGVATGGGNNNNGTIFKITPAGAVTTLYTFTGGNDGGEPGGVLMQARDGNLYGSTDAGASGYGTIFRITLGGDLTTLYTFTANDGFTGPDGAGAALIQASDGSFYGTTIEGGPHQCGTIFKMTPAGALTSLFSFSNLDGCVPIGLLQASDGNFYGEARWGGTVGDGTLYQVTPAGTVTTLHVFTGGDGNSPTGWLIQAADGSLYGTTQNGGANNDGTVFKLTLGAAVQAPTVSTSSPSAVTGSTATLGGSVNPNGTDTEVWFEWGTSSSLSGSASTPKQNIGSGTSASAVTANITGLNASTTYYFQVWAQNSAGTSQGAITSFTTSATATTYTLFGTVTLSGSGLSGVTVTVSGPNNASITTTSSGIYVAIVSAGGTYTVTPSLIGYTFVPSSATFSNLSSDQTQNFVATASATGLTLTTLVNFDYDDGAYPLWVGLIQGSDGNFYGTTSAGGDSVTGTIFKVTPSGTLTTLHSFAETDGTKPCAGLIQASDGNLYGTTSMGGDANNDGTVFKVTPAGVFTVVHGFGGTDGSVSESSLIQASDGNFYGTTAGGGNPGNGTVFKLTPAGTLTTLYNFGGNSGIVPYAGLIQASDGNFYGTTDSGGPNAWGIVFKITSAGAMTILYGFGGPDGKYLYGGVIQAKDGNFYGTTNQGGANGFGTVFKLTPAGALTTLHNFTSTDGAQPYGALVQASDGNFYGTTCEGGANNYGTIFEITPAGNLTTLHSFNVTDGACPMGALIQTADGTFYGTTSGGEGSFGTVFKLAPAPAPPAINPGGIGSAASYQAGIVPNSLFTIFGTNLSSTTDNWANAILSGTLPAELDGVSVSVGGLPAYIAYIGSGQINALAPNVAPGNVSVTVTNSNGTSAPVTVTAQALQPAFFQWGSYAVATRTDYSLAVKNGTFPGMTTVPAKPGDWIIFWGTGFGPTAPPAPGGVVVPSGTTYLTANTVTATVGGLPANVYDNAAALSSGYAGLYQLAIQIPNMADGDWWVIATISGVSSPSGVLITVQQ